MHSLAERITCTRMPRTRTKSPPKTALTVRLDPARIAQLQAAAAAENRSLTNYVETALLRDLRQRQEASGRITMHVAPGVPETIEPHEVLREPDETDEACAARQSLMVALWSLPDAGRDARNTVGTIR